MTLQPSALHRVGDAEVDTYASTLDVDRTQHLLSGGSRHPEVGLVPRPCASSAAIDWLVGRAHVSVTAWADPVIARPSGSQRVRRDVLAPLPRAIRHMGLAPIRGVARGCAPARGRAGHVRQRARPRRRHRPQRAIDPHARPARPVRTRGPARRRVVRTPLCALAPPPPRAASPRSTRRTARR